MLSLVVLKKVMKFIENCDEVSFVAAKGFLSENELIYFCDDCYERITQADSIVKKCCLSDMNYLIRFYDLVKNVSCDIDNYIELVYKE